MDAAGAVPERASTGDEPTGPSALLLAEPVWRAREAAHAARVDAWLAPHLQRRRLGQAHPVEDFLFTYYSHRPARLRRWHPGAGAALAGAAAEERRSWRHYGPYDGGVGVDPAAIDPALRRRARDVRALLVATGRRPARFSCFGMHEWAMVHGVAQGDVRHAGWPLRLGEAGTAAVVEAAPLQCTHYDAFRFFTDSARPRNTVQPSRDRVLDLEQPGCLHVTMDLYRWAYTLEPLVPGELVADCLELARAVRELDMRASPYDLRGLGYEPVEVETPAGRAQYAAGQRGFAARGAVLRDRLVGWCDRALGAGLSRPRPAGRAPARR